MTDTRSAAILRTERLRLRELTLEDAEFIHELVNDADWLRFIGDKGVCTLEDARRYLRDGPLASYARNGFGLWCVELSATDEALGICGLLRRDTLPDVDVGFAFLARHRGRGYAREAVHATLEHAFDSLRLARIVAITSPDNSASQRVLESAGLRFESSVRLSPGDQELSLYSRSAS
jgi:ribosomal-protein-alanine N-acetyltransferase